MSTSPTEMRGSTSSSSAPTISTAGTASVNRSGMVLCLNCQTHMRWDEQLARHKTAKFSEESSSAVTEDMDGKSRSVMGIICDAEIAADAPICKECSDTLLSAMDSQLARLEEDCVQYGNLIEHLHHLRHTHVDAGSQRQQLANLADEEEKLCAELERLTKEEAELETQLQRKKALVSRESDEEARLWRNFRENKKLLLTLDEAAATATAELKYAEQQYNRLAHLNVLNFSFNIWVEGSVGCVNGLHLGRLPDQPVEWNEINAAWGQCALLLAILLERMNLRPTDYHIVALGSHSYIRVRRSSGALSSSTTEWRDEPLHGAGGWKTFGQHNCDAGTLAFLACMQLLHHALKEAFASSVKGPFTPIFAIRKDSFIDHRTNSEFCGKMQFNNEERWTRAMRCMLADLKHAMSSVETLRAAAAR